MCPACSTPLPQSLVKLPAPAANAFGHRCDRAGAGRPPSGAVMPASLIKVARLSYGDERDKRQLWKREKGFAVQQQYRSRISCNTSQRPSAQTNTAQAARSRLGWSADGGGWRVPLRNLPVDGLLHHDVRIRNLGVDLCGLRFVLRKVCRQQRVDAPLRAASYDQTRAVITQRAAPRVHVTQQGSRHGSQQG